MTRIPNGKPMVQMQFDRIRPVRGGMALLLGAAVLQGCVLSNAVNDKDTKSQVSSWMRPDDAQDQLGAREHPIVLAKYGGEYRNAEVEKLLALIVGRLVAVSDDKARTYKVTILNTPKINAFALPGGYLYITRGLLALANDSSEIAAVIAHEMAHVSSQHSILRREKERSVEVGNEVVSGVLDNSVAGRVAMAANQLKLAEFSKDQELQADSIGIRMLGNAGFDPFAAARFLETMQAYQSMSSRGNDGLGDYSFMSSHPATPRRVQLARQHARFFGAPETVPAGRERYLAGIDGMLFGDSVEEGFVRGNRFAHAGLGITFSAPQGAKMENQSTAVVVNGPGEIATRFDAAVLPRGQSLEKYLTSGWINGLEEGSIQSGTLNGFPSASAKATADQWDFMIRVFQIGGDVYRFITAAPAGDPALEGASSAVTTSFRYLNDRERAELRPLTIHVVTVAEDDTLGKLSGRMKAGSNNLALFQVLNGLKPGEMPQPGTKVKIVTD